METAKNSLSKGSNSDLVGLLNKGSMKTLLIIFLLYATNEQMNVTKNSKKTNDQLYILPPSLLNHMLQKTNLFFHFSSKKNEQTKTDLFDNFSVDHNHQAFCLNHFCIPDYGNRKRHKPKFSGLVSLVLCKRREEEHLFVKLYRISF